MRRRAFSLLEVVVVSGLSFVLLGLAIASFLMFNRTSRMQQGRIDARQQLRASMARVRAELEEGAYIFAGYHDQFAEQSYTVPALNAAPAAGELLFAVPQAQEASDSPQLWKVCGLRVVAHDPPDPNNPNADDILEESVENLGPVPGDDPAELKSLLPAAGPLSVTRFNAYVDPSSYAVAIRPAPFSVWMTFTFKVSPTDLAGTSNYSQSERFETEVLLRNQPPVAPSPVL